MATTIIPSDLSNPLTSSLVALSAAIPILAYYLSTSFELRTTAHAVALTLLRIFAYAVGYFIIALTILPITILYFVDKYWDIISPWNLFYRRPTAVVLVPAAPLKQGLTTEEMNMLAKECGGTKKTQRSGSMDSNISALDLGQSVIADSEGEKEDAVDLSLGDVRDVVVGKNLHQA